MVCLKCLKKNILPTKNKIIEFLIVVVISMSLKKVLIPNQNPNTNEKYVLGKRLGEGAVGEVFLSKTPEDISFAKENPFVAIKVRNLTVFSKIEVFTHRKLNNRYLHKYTLYTCIDRIFLDYLANSISVTLLSSWMTFTSPMELITL